MGPYVMAGLTDDTSIALAPGRIADAVSDVDENLMVVRWGSSYLQHVESSIEAAQLPPGLTGLQNFVFEQELGYAALLVLDCSLAGVNVMIRASRQPHPVHA